ncbi:Uncharacterised protein [Mycobacteroides abscessus]|nr:Uncharacterised protein [Mycobacteroides abscessus]
MAFAPSLPLFGVPSRSMRAASMRRWSSASKPMSSGAMSSITEFTAPSTPLPR